MEEQLIAQHTEKEGEEKREGVTGTNRLLVKMLKEVLHFSAAPELPLAPRQINRQII